MQADLDNSPRAGDLDSQFETQTMRAVLVPPSGIRYGNCSVGNAWVPHSIIALPLIFGRW